MITITPNGTKINYGVSRNMKAEDEEGNPIKIALVLIEHENGFKQRLAIQEEEIKFCGEDIILAKVVEEAEKGGHEYVRGAIQQPS